MQHLWGGNRRARRRHGCSAAHVERPCPCAKHKWVCIALYDKGDACGATVKFDGIEKGLCAVSEKTVYTRTMLDVILFTIISTKSSISAASAVSTYQLHCSGAITDGDSAQTRQELSNATEAYYRTLMVPCNPFKCEDCYHSP